MGGKQILVLYGYKVVYASKPFVNDEEQRKAYDKAIEVYDSLPYRTSRVIVETVYGTEVKAKGD